MTSLEPLIKSIKACAYLEGDFITRAGKPTHYYIDKYLFSTNPATLSPLVESLLTLLPPSETYDRLAAPELGAVPIAAVLSVAVGKPFVIVKKESKGYGTQKLVEGYYQDGDRVVVIEDILTTGGAALRACEVIQSLGMRVTQVVGVIDREEGAISNLESKGFKTQALISRTQLMACTL